MTATPVLAATEWSSNAELIADVARLGYLRKEWRTLDPTYGKGTFWKLWRPDLLIATDLAGTPAHFAADFRQLPWPARYFDAVVFDPPYKLNGTDQGEGERYGVHVYARWQDRIRLIIDGLAECIRVLGDGYLLVKCQDQVCSGKVRWQTDIVTNECVANGLGKVDRFDLLGGRPQPAGRSQIHARRNSSTLLVFKRGWESS